MKYIYTLCLFFTTAITVAQSSFLPSSSNSPILNRSNEITPIVATIGYQGYEEAQEYFGEGEYEIFLDTQDEVLDKPIIILDGFDPGDGRDITGLYNSLEFDGQNMADIIRAEGFDVIVLNAPNYTTGGKAIDGGSDYIQRNAMVLIEMINFLNAEKVGDEELVILGPSMGGLIARYALSYMEANSLPHETRLYISFDSPHRGANIPISLQYLINYLAETLEDPDAQAIVEFVLNSPAAKEMLVDHLLAHLLPGSTYEQDPNLLLPAGAPNFRDAFQDELDNLGFPQNVRNVAMVNGSILGNTVGTPGMQVVDTNLELNQVTSADVTLNFTPLASQTNTVTFFQTLIANIPVTTFEADAASSALSDGVDAAPGGTGNISAALGGGNTNPIIIAFIAALDQDEYSFIPLLSSLAIDEADWYTTPNLEDSPFVASYVPEENESHVTVTAASANFALEEIRNGVLANTTFALSTPYLLAQNPVNETIKLVANANQELSEVSLEVYNMLGQKVLVKERLMPANTHHISHSLATGVYQVVLKTTQQSLTFKMVVK